jgi:hypothetical protein
MVDSIKRMQYVLAVYVNLLPKRMREVTYRTFMMFTRKSIKLIPRCSSGGVTVCCSLDRPHRIIWHLLRPLLPPLSSGTKFNM